jgi:AsmA-like protein
VVKVPRWQWLTALLLVAAVAAAVTAAVFWLSRPESLRERAVAALSRDLESEVSLDALETSLRPSPRIVLRGLVVRHRGRRDIPPLIQIRSLTVDVSLAGWRAHRLDHVNVDGLQIFIPPRTDADIEKRKPAAPPVGEWYIDRLTATDASLRIGVREPGMPPREFHIHQLAMSAVGASRAMTFDAALTNPKPVGEIKSKGTFGPWQEDSPSLTPLEGTYAFSNADLATFKGIAGILTSDGRYRGVLERIEADGTTSTPDFRLSVGGNPVPLTTHYQAVIDGTNGNTVLKRIDAVLGQTKMSVSGAVIGIKGIEGRTITLDVDIPGGRLEDLLRLTVKGDKPPLTGGIVVKTSIRIPPGDRDVVDKLQLDGRFRVVAARFASLDIQKKLDELSRRGRGRPDEQGGGRTVSNVSGPFRLKNTAMTFPQLTFGVPGATVRLSGRYHMRQETLNFLGTLRLQATVSQTVTGIRRLLLKPIDPLFAREGMGTVLPIRIGGTRSNPAFALDVRSAIRRRDPS